MARVDVVAHITGNVWKYEARIGDGLEEGDIVVILESMKMEMPVEAPCDGTLIEIVIPEGKAVKEGEVLARMEES